MTLGNPFYTPPILFRGGDVYHQKSYLEEANDIIERLSPMTWLTDNPERAQRITQLGTQIQLLNSEVVKIDERMAKAKLDKALDLVLQQANQPTAEAYLAEVKKNLDKSQQEDWANAMANYEGKEWWVKACALIGGTLGTEVLLKFAGYPEQATLRELFTSIFLNWDGAPTARALSMFLRDWYQRFRGGPGLVPERPIGPGEMNVQGMNPLQEMDAVAANLAERGAARELVLVAEREVAYGARIAARIGGVALDIFGGAVAYVAVDAIINACEKGEYIDMEHDACVSRLTMARINEVFKLLERLYTSISTVSNLQADALAETNPEKRRWGLETATKQGKKAGDELIKMLEEATYSKVYDQLAADDIKYKVYTKDDLSKDELIKRTTEALTAQVKKEAEAQKLKN